MAGFQLRPGEGHAMPGCPSCGAAGQRAVIKATFAMSAVQQQPAVSSTCRLGLNIYASHHSLRMHASAAFRASAWVSRADGRSC
jgi:hypothetical protein